jgi:hypothetical protein
MTSPYPCHVFEYGWPHEAGPESCHEPIYSGIGWLQHGPDPEHRLDLTPYNGLGAGPVASAIDRWLDAIHTYLGIPVFSGSQRGT